MLRKLSRPNFKFKLGKVKNEETFDKTIGLNWILDVRETKLDKMEAPSLPPAKFVRGETDIFEYLHGVLKDRIMILDGAMGTMIQTHKLGEPEYVRSRVFFATQLG